VGLPESAALAAFGCGLEVDEVEEDLEPVVAEQDYASAVPVRVGQVAGKLDAEPPLRLVIPGGVAGDQATAWTVVHAAASIVMLQGLVSVLDLPPGR
jgi:4-hydroxy-tetrahydrodipicolinate reductase